MYFAGHLFDLLLQRKLPYPVLRFLIQWYSQQCFLIRWSGTLSTSFTVANGVRQGGILPLILFTCYIDELMQQLSSLGVSCHWKGLLVGWLCYADDLALLAPSTYALSRMLKICSEFAAERNLVFNASWEDSIDVFFLRTQIYCGWWLHWILWPLF